MALMHNTHALPGFCRINDARPGLRPHPATARGFTLIELMVTLSVLAVLLTIAAPSFSRLLAQNRLTTRTDELMASLSLARSEAIRRAQPATLRANDADNYASGWKVFPDSDANGVAASGTNDTDGKTLQETTALRGATTARRVTRSAAPAPFTYTDATDTTRMYVVFTARGAIADTAPAFFRVCDPANTSTVGRIVQVNVVGKVSLDSTSATCS